ncbi:MAG: efflux RND transporter permease subunit [Pseudomonadota bacterium]
MNTLIDLALRYSRTVVSVFVLLIIAGWSAYISIPKESMPDVQIPIIYISLHHEGISPEDAERLLIRPLEQKLRGIEGVKEMKATAHEGGGNILLEFIAGFNADKAKADVRDKVDEAKPDLPTDTDDPTIHEVNVSLFPVLVISLSGQVPQRSLYKLARDLRDEIEENVPSVLQVNVVGDRDEVVEILIDPIRLEGYGFSFEETIGFVRKNNQLISAGTLDTGLGRMAIKVPGLLQTSQDLLDLPLKSEDDAVVKFSDVADLRRTFKDPTGYARDRGTPAVALEVIKRTGQNIIETIEGVRKVVAEEKENWPAQIQVNFSQDESGRIRDMLADLQNSLIIAVLLVMLVIVRSLGWSSAWLVGLAVPGSFLMGIFTLQLLGLTLNTVVLFSLILAVGMLVDGAIIVVEYADRHMAEGAGRKEAYAQAAKRMAWPVITSITTILVVFFPLLFWPGVIGKFMRFLPLTLIATLTASILMALVFVPTIGSLIGRAQAEEKPNKPKMSGLSEFQQGLTGWYVRTLDYALDRPKTILLGALAALVSVFILYKIFGKGIEFFPNIEPPTALVMVHARGNLSVAERDRLVQKVENKLLDMQELQSIYTNSDVGRQVGRTGPPLPQDVIGTITLEFVDWQQRRTADKIIQEVNERVGSIPGIIVEIRKNKPGPPADKNIQIQLSSRFPEKLDIEVKKLKTYVDSLPGLINVDDTGSIPGIDWEIKIDRAQAAKFGADVTLIGQTIQLITAGLKIDSFRPDDSRDEVDIVVRFPKEFRTLEQLKKLRVKTSKGLVPISTFMTLAPQSRVSVLNRTNSKRSISVEADVAPGVLTDDKVQEIAAWIRKTQIDPAVNVAFKGEEEDKKETGSFLIKAFAIAIFSIAIILVTQFNSFFSMVLILSSVVMSTFGVFIGLIIMRQTYSIVMGGIGIIALSGIIVSNNIILLDTFDHLKVRMKNVRDAILLTGAQRLRPVILTKLTTILGLLPIMLGLNIDFLNRSITYGSPATQWWVQLATAIVFGVLFASTLTLVVTPCALMARENYRVWKQEYDRLYRVIWQWLWVRVMRR